MRIIDRYVFSSFLRNYLISFFVLVGMYVDRLTRVCRMSLRKPRRLSARTEDGQLDVLQYEILQEKAAVLARGSERPSARPAD